MKKSEIVYTEETTSYIRGRGIPKGCKFCLKGLKAVLFLNGICQKPDHCSWYCPISEERRDKESTFADEIEIDTKEGLLEEINKINAKGMSITGGEPLSKLNLKKTLDYLRYIKLKKGKKFHIHLYTNGINFNEKIAENLANEGLNEIRFHPPKKKWPNIKLALNKGMIVGGEVPIIPEYENTQILKEFIIYLNNINADFLNLNEFEFCFPNSQSLKDRGFRLKKGSIASVVNSRESALAIIRELGPKVSIKMHFCSIKAKDYYQLKNRYLRRAKNVKLPFEVINEEGLLIFAQIEGEKEELVNLHKNILSGLKTNEKLIIFDKKTIKLPFYIAINNQFLSLLENHKLKGYIIEMIPFRISKYQQVTEKTPIQLFKKQFGFNED
ncbi:hypothetical protein LCGC14_1199480 [marine sediment metagenome]|uniref:Radical SAM core domain-containing protein n=1 Tax=marine sediment metagenome TaxID=412755 RepID=A0A0F9M4R3_9ZZZZ